VGDFLKEVPHAPQEPSGHKKTACGVFGWPAPEEFCFAKFFPQMVNGSPLRLLLTRCGEGSTLFQSDFACGEIGSRELRGPSPIRSTILELLQLFASTPAARGGSVASDALKTFMSFSCSALQSGTGREIEEGTSWHVFLVPSLTCVKEGTST
jgi:hypothetical protein